MLSQPQETLELQQKQSKAVAVTSLSFPAGDVNNFIVGSEEGAVYTACRHGSRAGVLDVFEGHQVQNRHYEYERTGQRHPFLYFLINKYHSFVVHCQHCTHLESLIAFRVP